MDMDMMNISRAPRHPQGPQAGYRFASAFVIGLAMVGAGVPGPAGGDGAVSAQALNPCTLLTVDEIEPLAGNADVGEGVSSSLQAFGSVTCRYAWGVGVNRLKLDIVVNEAPQMFPGMSPEQIKQRLLESNRVGEVDAVIPDVGEAAVFTSDSPYYASATAALKGRILELHLDGRVAREKKDQMIELLKSAVARL
jgi:hypothetical protein